MQDATTQKDTEAERPRSLARRCVPRHVQHMVRVYWSIAMKLDEADEVKPLILRMYCVIVFYVGWYYGDALLSYHLTYQT